MVASVLVSNKSNNHNDNNDNPTTTTTTMDLSEEDLDRLELEAALSAACMNTGKATEHDSTTTTSTAMQQQQQQDKCETANDTENHDTTTSTTTNQVFYNQNGGTKLFCALEQCEWQRAFDLISTKGEAGEQPSSEAASALQTWVKSTGTTNTTFGWAIWRRLPIHEAVRRQAPAWLLVKMLSLYPESAWQTTQFGELPLHLAVETGSTPEVLHLLLIAYMEGTMKRDNSGRTPLDLVLENDYADPIVVESLTRATHNQERLVQSYEGQLEDLRKEHAQNVQSIEEKHKQALEEEWDRQSRLQGELKEGQQFAASMKKLGDDSKAKADQKIMETHQWRAKVMKLKEDIEERERAKKKQEEVEQDLRAQLDQRERTIADLLHQIDVLSKDLSNSLVFRRDTVIKSMNAANEDLQRMMASQQALQGHLTGEVQGLEMLLEKRGIDIPPLPPKPKKEPAPPEVDTSAAVAAASKAANKALEVSNAKQGYV